jgi:peptide/nickel transport system substrate-binding protein
VVVGITESLEGHNPYAQLDSLKLGLWCEVYGCLLIYDFEKNEYVPLLAESWKVENPTTWVFNLRKGVTFHDGSPFTAADVLHSIDRAKNDPQTRQAGLISEITDAVAVDQYTIRLTTRLPMAEFLSRLEGRLTITSKAAYEQHGQDVYEKKPVGTGPYMLKELVPDQHVTIVKNPNWWGGPVKGPDEVTYRVMREDEVRVAALLNPVRPATHGRPRHR